MDSFEPFWGQTIGMDSYPTIWRTQNICPELFLSHVGKRQRYRPTYKHERVQLLPSTTHHEHVHTGAAPAPAYGSTNKVIGRSNQEARSAVVKRPTWLMSRGRSCLSQRRREPLKSKVPMLLPAPVFSLKPWNTMAVLRWTDWYGDAPTWWPNPKPLIS